MPLPHIANTMTDAEIDDLLQRFDQSPVRLQRRIIARFVADRELLLQAARKAATVSWDRLNVERILGRAIEVVERKTEEES